jgi:hypothetical protein
MKQAAASLALALVAAVCCGAQTPAGDTDFKLALPNYQGQLQWHADGFKIVQSSAKPNGQEIGLRGRDESGKLTFLGFLFTVPGESALTGAKCRDDAMRQLKKGAPTLQVPAMSEIAPANNLPVELATYSAKGADGKPLYSARGFVAAGNVCGDLELYSQSPITPDDSDIKRIFQSYHFDPSYTPQFRDVSLYAEILYRDQMYKAAAPMFELALTKLKDEKDQRTWIRVTTDQAGMSYGMSGDAAKARSLFEAAVAKDPDYPMYYYNLACADAQEHKLADARTHLQQAFARKANMIQGEIFPDPSKDDSFTPYRDDKEFWKFVESLH